MVKEAVHKKICDKISEVEEWFIQKSEELDFPFYSSYDIRDSSFKVAPVDANLFPAGFNNICPVDKENAPDLVADYLKANYASLKRVLLLTEEHSKNAYYWENINTLKTLIEQSGCIVTLAMPSSFDSPIQVESISGVELTVNPSKLVNGKLDFSEFDPQVIICNNDFSNAYEAWMEPITLPMNPPRQLGWYARRKDTFFTHYNNYVDEFSKIIDVSPSVFNVRTDAFKDFDISSEESRTALAAAVDKFISELKEDYKKQGIETEPFVFVKNSSGTYGLGVVKANSGADILAWNYKDRKKMKAVKGGGKVNQLIIQEGIPSAVCEEGKTAEPVIYTVGGKLVGGFLRTHSDKGPMDNLNSPGAVYKKLCVSDLQIDVTPCAMTNVYGWVARISGLAIAKEVQEANLKLN